MVYHISKAFGLESPDHNLLLEWIVAMYIVLLP